MDKLYGLRCLKEDGRLSELYVFSKDMDKLKMIAKGSQGWSPATTEEKFDSPFLVAKSANYPKADETYKGVAYKMYEVPFII